MHERFRSVFFLIRVKCMGQNNFRDLDCDHSVTLVYLSYQINKNSRVLLHVLLAVDYILHGKIKN